MRSPRPKIVLLGMLSKTPVGGVAWLVAQYAIGFQRMGFDVYYVEAHALAPSMLLKDEGDDGTEAATRVIHDLMKRLGMADKWAFHALHHDGRCYGMTETELRRLYRNAALIVNLHGTTRPRPEQAETGRLVYLGTDPVHLELQLHRQEEWAIEFLEPHIAYFTWGLNHGNPDCTLPWSIQFPFVPSPPPVVTDLWANDIEPEGAPFTTIGNWRQEARDVKFAGETYRWSKHHEFLRIIELPQRVDAPLELALASYDESDALLLRANGWGVRPALEFSCDVRAYRDYIIGSRGELSVAKDQNLRFRTGWFSERSATYLAAGRPVIVQDTGFGNALPTGAGLFAFGDMDEAVAALEEAEAHPQRHRRAARELAREHLDHDVVLGALLDHVGVTPPKPSRRRPPPAAPPLPPALPLTPIKRRPLQLHPEVEHYVRTQPIPAQSAPVGTQPEASVVMVTINNVEATRLALDSVLANTPGSSCEVIVVDNGSGPPTHEYLSVLAARNANVRLIRNGDNRGFGPATNQGITAARGRHIVLLNNDVVVAPGWLSGLLAHLADERVGMVGPVTNRCGNEAEVPAPYNTYGGLLAHARERAATMKGRSFGIPVAVMFCVALRREVVEQVGLLDERFELGLFEDDDYAKRVRDARLEIRCAEDVFVHHFGEASLGWLAAAGRYGEIFEANKQRFEKKWATTWSPHRRRAEHDYFALQQRLRDAAIER